MVVGNNYFKKRQFEPEEMDKTENEAFASVASEQYVLWFVTCVDYFKSLFHPKRNKILDIGCGPGYLVKELSKQLADCEIVGIDLSNQAVKYAKKTCFNLKNTTFKKDSVYDLSFPDNYFDFVISKDTFHHFQKPDKALQEIFRVLKPGGWLYVQDLRRDLPFYLLKTALPKETVFQKIQYYSARASFLKSEIKKMLFFHKFKKINVKTRLIKKEDIKRYSKKISIDRLRGSFQSRYIALAQKPV